MSGNGPRGGGRGRGRVYLVQHWDANEMPNTGGVGVVVGGMKDSNEKYRCTEVEMHGPGFR